MKNILIKFVPENLTREKLQSIIANNFISSIDNYEELVMHSKSDDIGIIINDEADEFIKELFDSLKNKYQHNLE